MHGSQPETALMPEASCMVRDGICSEEVDGLAHLSLLVAECDKLTGDTGNNDQLA